MDHHPQQTTRLLNNCGQKVFMKSKRLLPCKRGTEQAQSKSSWSSVVLFHETSLHTQKDQKKLFAKLFNSWFALTPSRRFTKCLKQCFHTFSHRTDTLNYIRHVSRTITMLFNQYFSGQVMNSNIGLEVYSQ